MNYKTDSISIDGFTMKYLKFGEGSETLVILPGLSAQSVIPLAPYIAKKYESLTKDFTVYLFDRRFNVPAEYSVSDMACDTVKVIEALKLQSISLFGASQGGMIALTIAAEYPELVKKLVIVSTVMHIDTKRFSIINQWITLAEKNDSKGLYLAISEKVYPKDYFEKYKQAFCQIAKTMTKQDHKRFIILANGAKSFDISNSAEKIKCPVLYIGDEYDAVFTDKPEKEIEQLLGINDHFEIKMFSGFGHALYDTLPDFCKIMLHFLIQ